MKRIGAAEADSGQRPSKPRGSSRSPQRLRMAVPALRQGGPEAMRIAQVAPLSESVPPKLYGGTERVVAYLTDECVRRGHEVTLFASGDSVTAARLRPACRRALRLEGAKLIDPLAHHVRMIEMVAREAHTFDIVH